MKIQTPTVLMQPLWLLAAGILQTHQALQDALLEQVTVILELVQVTILVSTFPCKGRSMKWAIVVGMNMGCLWDEMWPCFGPSDSAPYMFAFVRGNGQGKKWVLRFEKRNW